MLSSKEQYHLTLSAVSHEIRNPVTIISSYLQLTQKHYPQVKDFDTWTPIMENMDYLIQLLQDLSLYNNAEKLHKVPTNLSVLIHNLVKDCTPALSNISISCSIDKDLGPAYIDNKKIRSVLLNIIRNGAEALSGTSNGHIHIILTSSDKDYIIHLCNNGPVIPVEHMDDIFQPFVTHKLEGTGLGLALSKEIVSAHGGEISVSSVPSQTIFTIRIPHN